MPKKELRCSICFEEFSEEQRSGAAALCFCASRECLLQMTKRRAVFV